MTMFAEPTVPGGDGLRHLTFRQLLASKSLARRAARKGPNRARAQAMIRRIEKELESRRKLKWSNIATSLPDVPALDEQANDGMTYLRPYGRL